MVLSPVFDVVVIAGARSGWLTTRDEHDSSIGQPDTTAQQLLGPTGCDNVMLTVREFTTVHCDISETARVTGTR